MYAQSLLGSKGLVVLAPETTLIFRRTTEAMDLGVIVHRA
jgi:hypothetical protein